METWIIILILYWFICTMFAIGIDYYRNEVSLFTIIVAIFMAWIVIPMGLGGLYKKMLDEK